MTTEVDVSYERYRPLTGFWRWIVIALSFVSLIIVVNQIFDLRLFGLLIMANQYYYLVLAAYVSLAFLLFPIKKGASGRRFFWFDVFLFLLSLSLFLVLAKYGFDAIYKAWGYDAPRPMMIMSVILWVLLLEAVRRTSGKVLLTVILVFSLYPLFAPYMPGFLEGTGRTFAQTAAFHLLTTDSVVGIPTRVVAELVIGFMVFGVALQATGGGRFFLNLAFALLGATRGGPAKVAVVASGLFGSISGSVISNVITTGSVTIPAMKKAGFRAEEAGAIETCASTGGVLMPPVMGAVAFVMAAFLEVSYVHIAVAAAIPSILYYLGLFIQIDAVAAKTGLMGLPRSEIPSLIKTLKEGWIYLLAMAVLIYYLFVLRLVAQAPFYATAALLVVSMIRKETRFTPRTFLQFIENTGRFLSEVATMLAGVGLILGALIFTGVAQSLARELVDLAGGNVILMLIFGALASAILGMGLTTTAVYVFLAVTLAPALVLVGLNPLAVHLFVLYWGMVSNITPPVAIAAFPAAALAQTSPMRVGLTAARMGGIIYFLPFFFVLGPALILQGSAVEILHAFFSALLGVVFIGSALQGYLVGIGRLEFGGRVGSYLCRAALLASGVLLGLPGWPKDVSGLAIAFVIILLMLLLKLRSSGASGELRGEG